MDLAVLEPALLAWASALTGVPLAVCRWANAPRVQHSGRLVLLSWVSSVAVGTDAAQYDYAPAVDPLHEMTPTVTGNRLVVVQLDVEVHDQTSGASAQAAIDRARVRLLAPSTLALLEDVGLALAGPVQTAVTDYEVDGRQVSRRTMDVRLHGVAIEADLAGRTSYIATVGTVADLTPPVAASISPGGTL